ncbi:MAG: pyridoxal-phosphate dependent enzyme [Pseudomonadota bacterium]
MVGAHEVDQNALTFTPDYAAALRHFRAQPGYQPSPLHHVSGPAGITVMIKDETNRMGLGAFKALGGPYAIAGLLSDAWTADTGEAPLHGSASRAFASKHTFVTASAGNHGIGVAAGAKAAGAHARIYLAETVPEAFDARLTGHGAEVVRAGATYEASIAAAIEDTEKTGATLLADGTWPGYTEIPKRVMEGYTVIAEELRAHFETDGAWPSHVYVQAGVGGLAAAMAHMIRQSWTVQPDIIIVEPEAAPCLKASHAAGRPVAVSGPVSEMGRLDCKDPSIVAFETLERCDVRYITLSEDEGAQAAHELQRLGIATTPSGAAGFGGLAKDGQVSPDHHPLIIATERAG